MNRVAAIDCGTNSVRLLIADIPGDELAGVRGDGLGDISAELADISGGELADVSADELADVERRMEIVRLGQGVDRTGRLAPDALERTFTTMRGYAKLILEHGGAAAGVTPADVMPVRVVATSATRDASNRADFVAGVREIFGVDPEVVTGSEEAHLSFTGATRGLVRAASPAGSSRAATAPYLVVDIGGGSTEFVVGTADADAALSVDIGCVRLTERHLREDPPGAAAVQAVISDIDAALDRVEAVVPVRAARTLVGLAGSVTTVAGIALDLPAYDPARIHHSRIPADQVHEVSARLLAMTHDERAALPVMHPGRVDVIGAGAAILDRIVRRYGFAEVVVSEHDILDGIAWSLS